MPSLRHASSPANFQSAQKLFRQTSGALVWLSSSPVRFALQPSADVHINERCPGRQTNRECSPPSSSQSHERCRVLQPWLATIAQAIQIRAPGFPPCVRRHAECQGRKSGSKVRATCSLRFDLRHWRRTFWPCARVRRDLPASGYKCPPRLSPVSFQSIDPRAQNQDLRFASLVAKRNAEAARSIAPDSLLRHNVRRLLLPDARRSRRTRDIRSAS